MSQVEQSSTWRSSREFEQRVQQPNPNGPANAVGSSVLAEVNDVVTTENEKSREHWKLRTKLQTTIPNHETLRKGSGYFRLLFKTNPAKIDLVLIATGTLAAIAAGIPYPLLGILFGQLVDDMNSTTCGVSDSSRLQSGVDQKVIKLIYVTVFNFFAIYIHSACWSLVGERLVRRLREAYFRSLLRQEIAYFDTLPAGEVSSRLAGDLEVIQTGTAEKVGLCISSLSYFVAAYAVSFMQDVRLTGMLFSLVPAFFLMVMVGGKYIQKYTGAMSDHIAAATAIASESLTNMTIVHAFGANDRLEKIFASHLMKSQKQGLKKATVAAAQLGTMYSIGYLANALAFWQGSRHIAADVDNNGDKATVGKVYTVIFLLLDASFILSQVAPFLQIFGSAAGAAEKLLETINRSSAIDGTSSDDGDCSDITSSHLEFRDVSFTYPSRPEVLVLNSVSLVIPANRHTAIVGLSGSGKSTITSLLLRLYDPNSGSVLLNGRDMRALNVRHVRGNIGLVQQEPTLLDRSILENIAHGLVNSSKHRHLRPTLLDSSLPDFAADVRAGMSVKAAMSKHGPAVEEVYELVQKAVDTADAAPFVARLSHGFATTVGTAGKQLSGGQKQRIAIARALVREPAVLILDEATAALDSLSELSIQSALEQAAAGRTTLSIAHRLATIKKADNIIVMEKGRIVEQGTHGELLAKGGLYANMVRLQTLGNSDSSDGASRASTIVASQHELVIDEKIDELEPASDTERGSVEDNVSNAGYEKPQKPLWQTICGIARLSRPQLLFVVIGLAGSAIVGGAYSGEAVIFGHTIGALNPCEGADNIRRAGRFFGLLFFILAIVEICANVANGSAFGWVAEKMLYRVRVLSLRSLFHQDIHWHESEGRTPSTLLSYISADANSLGALTGTIIGILFSIIVNLIAGIALSHAIAWKIAVVLLATIPLVLASGFMRLHVLAQFQKRHQKAFAQSVAITVEAVSSIRTIATFSLEHESLEVFRRSLKKPYDATLRSIAKGNFWLALAYSVSNLVYAMAYWWGFKQVVSGLYTQTQFFIVLPALLFSAQSCGQMFSLAPDITKARVSAGNILHLLDIGPSEHPQDDDHAQDPEKTLPPIPPSSRPGMSIELRNLHFSYPSRRSIPVLRGLSLTVPASAFCALVGASGSGKSTTLAILERFFKPDDGQVLLDGVDISAAASSAFRDDIALVPQEGVLFCGTVAFNVGLGARAGHEPTLEEVVEACKRSNVHETIMALPDGYETLCGSNGTQFSGGQRQRLAIARALVRRPRLLLLDEGTSALDAESERLVQESLEKVARGITVVAIAHRLNTIRRADRIFVVREGRVVDQGRHEELVQRCEEYRRNAMAQMLDT